MSYIALLVYCNSGLIITTSDFLLPLWIDDP